MVRLSVLLAAATILLLCAPLFAPYDPLLSSQNALSAPSRAHLLGTDALGRDVLSRLLHGGQRTVGISITALCLAVSIGTLMGIAASGKGIGSQAVTALIDGLLAFPGLLAALMILTLLGRGVPALALGVGLPYAAPYARYVRGLVFVIRQQPHVEAARAMGAGLPRLFVHHILRNIFPDMAAFAAAVFAYCLSTSAALSFLGLGGPPGIPDWGVMLQEGRAVLLRAPWVAAGPAFLITMLVASANRLALRRTSADNRT